MSDIERSRTRSRSPRRRHRSREGKDTQRTMRDEPRNSRSRSRSASRGRKPYRRSKYSGHRSRSQSKSPYRNNRTSRSRSRSYSRSRSRYSKDRNGAYNRDHSHSPMSSRRRHVGNRENPGPSRCLGVFGLNIHTTEQQLYNIFSKYGAVDRVVVVIDAKTKRSRGFCFVYYESSEDARVAKEQCSGMEIGGRRIRVDFSITHRAHTPTPGIYMGKPTQSYNRGYDSRRREGNGYRSNYRGSPSPHYNKRRSRYDRSRSQSYSPQRRY